MRRRLRQQNRMREALLVDLGALVYELHRHGRREPELLQAKAAELTAVDGEVRALADALDAGYDMLALVSAGIAGSCERCGSLLASNARYCSSCGASAVASLAGDATADGQDAGSGTVADAGSEPLQQPDRDLDLSTDEVEAVRPQTEADREPEPEREVVPQPQPEAEVVPEPEPEPQPEREVVPQPDPVPEPERAVVPQHQPDAEAEPEPEREVVPQPDPEPDPSRTAAPTYPPPRPPPPQRRRSGGAVGRVAGAIKRARRG